MFNSFKDMSDAEYAEMVSSIISNILMTIPHLLLLIGTLWFAWLAHKHTQDKFRLDLFEKRWEVYENILNFTSAVMSAGGFPNKHTWQSEESYKNKVRDFMDGANGSVRGKGFHLYKHLFGPELQKDFDKLNSAYAFFVTYNEPGTITTTDVMKEKNELLKFVVKYPNEMPEKFKKYIYFGDIKAK